jgi:hypothetical protein
MCSQRELPGGGWPPLVARPFRRKTQEVGRPKWVSPMPGSHAARALAALLCSWTLSLLLAPGWAGEARVIEAASPDHVVVETRDANADEVLEALSARFAFAIEGEARARLAIRYSGLLRGSLDQLIERLLRHQEGIVVRSAEAAAGVSRVIFLEANGGGLADANGSPTASAVRGSLALSSMSVGYPAKARQQLPALWSGFD